MPSDQSSGDFERLAQELSELRERMEAIYERLQKLESSLPQAAPPPQRRKEGSLVDEEIEIIDADVVEAEASAEPPSDEAHRPAAMSDTRPPQPRRPADQAPASPGPLEGKLAHVQNVMSEQWEDIVGGRWMTYAGALTLIVAIGFFVPWAWTQLELPDWSKVLMLHGLGVVVSIAAFVLHRRDMKIFAQGLAGIGIFTLYASAWAAQHHYDLWQSSGDLITFIECSIITALAIAAAVASRSVAIVLLGALGGYLTPFIAGGQDSSHIELFAYLAFLNVALVGSAVFRGWSFLKPIALLATIFMFGLWQQSSTFDAEYHTWSTQWLLTAHWFIFLLGATLPPVVWKRESNWLDLLALSTGSLWFVGVTWLLFHDRPQQQMALFCWGMTALHLVLFGLTYNRVTNVDRMPRVHLALAAIFFILAMPLQLEDSLSYLGLAWAAQGVVLSAVGIYFRDKQMCVSSLIVFSLSALRLLLFDYFDKPELLGTVDRRLLMFEMSALLMVLGGALYPLAGRLLRKEQQNARFWEPVGGALMSAGNLLAMIGLTCQWDSRLVLLLWTLDAAVIWAAGFILPRYGQSGRVVRTYGLLLAVVFVGGRALYHGDDVGRSLAGDFTALANDRFGTLLLLAGVYFAAAWSYRKLQPEQGTRLFGMELMPEKFLDPAVAVLGNLVLVAAFSLEIHSWFDAQRDLGRQPFGHMQMAEQASYSILWSVYSAVAVVLGLVLRWPALRIVGLIGLAIKLLKVFFIDLSSLILLARVVALAVLGLMLLVVSFIYQKFAAKLKDS